MSDNVIDLPIYQASFHVGWEIDEPLGDAVVKIIQNDNIIKMTPLQGLTAITELSKMIYEALEYNIENGFDSKPA